MPHLIEGYMEYTNDGVFIVSNLDKDIVDVWYGLHENFERRRLRFIVDPSTDLTSAQLAYSYYKKHHHGDDYQTHPLLASKKVVFQRGLVLGGVVSHNTNGGYYRRNSRTYEGYNVNLLHSTDEDGHLTIRLSYPVPPQILDGWLRSCKWWLSEWRKISNDRADWLIDFMADTRTYEDHRMDFPSTFFGGLP